MHVAMQLKKEVTGSFRMLLLVATCMTPGDEDTWTGCVTVHDKAGSSISVPRTQQPPEQRVFRQQATG